MRRTESVVARRARCAAGALLVALCCSPVCHAAKPALLCDETAGILQEVSAIRGLSVKQTVPCIVQDKAQVQGFLEETISRDLAPDKIEMEQRVYRALGIIPDDYDYGKNLVQFLVSQLGGYYDPRRERFVMAAWLPFSVQRTVAVHELTHALQDQHYNLEAFLDPTSDNSDGNLARAALIEGDATAVMMDDERENHGFGPLRQEKSVDGLVLQQILAMNIGGQTGAVPESLKATLIFPYSSGLRFVHTILRTGGYGALEKVYRNPPTSSREILHPEQYMAGLAAPRIPSPLELAARANRERLEYSDVMGEFVISSIFASSRATRAKGVEAAKGWLGDRVGILPLAHGAREIIWLTRWETTADAQEFYETYGEFLSDRYDKPLQVGFTQLSPSKYVQLFLSTSEVLVRFKITAEN